MIIDKIENAKLYVGIGDRIAKAFAYIHETDLSQLAIGKYEIDNDDVFAIIQEYDTKDESEGKIEGHSKYIDIHYTISGLELIGVTTLIDQKPILKNEENDYAIYEGDLDFIKIDKGVFALFFPDDLHMPGIKLNKISKIKKVVIKVRF